jgi:hypothetical protein
MVEPPKEERKKGRKAFFFEKKKQKTFGLFGALCWARRGQEIKVFCFFFSKKKAFPKICRCP